MQHLQSSWPTTYMFYKKQQKKMQSSPTHHRLWFPWRAPSAAIAPSSPEAITEQLSPQRYQDTCCGLLRGGDWHDDWHCHVNPGVAVSSDWFSRTLNHVHALPKLCEVSLETAKRVGDEPRATKAEDHRLSQPSHRSETNDDLLGGATFQYKSREFFCFERLSMMDRCLPSEVPEPLLL
jgi:hypothetical protein